jgi:hypothetical protein
MYLERIKEKLGSTRASFHTGKSETVKKLARKKGVSVKRSKHAMGGDITPSPAAAKYGHKKGKRVKREHHMIGEILGAASAIPAIIDLIRSRKR